MSDQSPEPSLAQPRFHPIRPYLVRKQDEPAAAPPRELEGHAVIVEPDKRNVRRGDVTLAALGCGKSSRPQGTTRAAALA
jgi:hypothetical protein